MDNDALRSWVGFESCTSEVAFGRRVPSTVEVPLFWEAAKNLTPTLEFPIASPKAPRRCGTRKLHVSKKLNSLYICLLTKQHQSYKLLVPTCMRIIINQLLLSPLVPLILKEKKCPWRNRMLLLIISPGSDLVSFLTIPEKDNNKKQPTLKL